MVELRGTEVLSDGWTRLERVRFTQVRRDGVRQDLAREVYRLAPGAAVLPYDPGRGTVLLVRQLRVPALVNGDDPMLIEVPAGQVEPGQDPADTVLRELAEETGYRAHRLRKRLEVYSSPGASSETLHLFLAEYGASDRIGPPGGMAAEGEEIELLEMTLAEAMEMLEDGRIRDAKTAMLLLRLSLDLAVAPSAAAPRPAGS